MSKIPSRWFPYVEACAAGVPPAARLVARAEALMADHKRAHKTRLKRSLARRKGAADEATAATGARRAVREACLTRAGGRCEACGASGLELALDHFFGRARSELVETCWMLCAQHDFEKTNNLPGRRFWLLRFRRHAEKHGYGRALQLVDQQLALDAAQHPSPEPT